MGKLPWVVSIDAMLVMGILLIISQEHFFSFIEYILFGKYWSNRLRYKCLLGHSLAKKIGRGVSHQASAKFSCNRIWMPRQNLDFYVVSFPPASQLAIRHLEAFNIKLCGKLNYGSSKSNILNKEPIRNSFVNQFVIMCFQFFLIHNAIFF